MKRTDFRIGNFVTLADSEWDDVIRYFNEHVDVSDIINNKNKFASINTLSDEVELITYGINLDFYDYNEIKPIPLNEYWLDLFGFDDYWDDDFDNHIFCFRNDDLTVVLDPNWVSQDDFMYVFVYWENNQLNNMMIKYVHQLQNLFYVLSGGIELETKIR